MDVLSLYGIKICKTNKYFNLRNAIDTDKYLYDKKTAYEVRNQLGYKDNDYVIGHVGRFATQKNHEYLIDIFNAIHKRDNRFKLILVGDGELRSDVKMKIKEYNLEDAVLFTGVRPDVYKLMQAMDLFLFPSLYEGLPVSVVEAQAAGLPCVISESITKEVRITSLVEQVSLDSSLDVWVNAVMEKLPHKKENMKTEIEESGYDIRTSVEWLTDFYLKIGTR